MLERNTLGHQDELGEHMRHVISALTIRSSNDNVKYIKRPILLRPQIEEVRARLFRACVSYTWRPAQEPQIQVCLGRRAGYAERCYFPLRTRLLWHETLSIIIWYHFRLRSRQLERQPPVGQSREYLVPTMFPIYLPRYFGLETCCTVPREESAYTPLYLTISLMHEVK